MHDQWAFLVASWKWQRCFLGNLAHFWYYFLLIPPLLPSGLWLSTNLLYSSAPQLGSMPLSLLISPSCPRENSAEPAPWPVPSALSSLITLSSRVTWWLSTAVERPVSWPSCWSLQRSLLLFIMKIPNQVSTKWLITIRIKGSSVLNSIALPRKYMLDCLWIRGHTLCNLLLKGIAKKKIHTECMCVWKDVERKSKCFKMLVDEVQWGVCRSSL